MYTTITTDKNVVILQNASWHETEGEVIMKGDMLETINATNDFCVSNYVCAMDDTYAATLKKDIDLVVRGVDHRKTASRELFARMVPEKKWYRPILQVWSFITRRPFRQRMLLPAGNYLTGKTHEVEFKVTDDQLINRREYSDIKNIEGLISL